MGQLHLSEVSQSQRANAVSAAGIAIVSEKRAEEIGWGCRCSQDTAGLVVTGACGTLQGLQLQILVGHCRACIVIGAFGTLQGL